MPICQRENRCTNRESEIEHYLVERKLIKLRLLRRISRKDVSYRETNSIGRVGLVWRFSDYGQQSRDNKTIYRFFVVARSIRKLDFNRTCSGQRLLQPRAAMTELA